MPAGCQKCGGRKAGEPAPESLAALRSGYTMKANNDGMYPLASAPDDLVPYHGWHQLASVYVVGYGDPEVERVFRRVESRDAYSYARENDARINPVVARNLGHETMTKLFGA